MTLRWPIGWLVGGVHHRLHLHRRRYENVRSHSKVLLLGRYGGPRVGIHLLPLRNQNHLTNNLNTIVPEHVRRRASGSVCKPRGSRRRSAGTVAAPLGSPGRRGKPGADPDDHLSTYGRTGAPRFMAKCAAHDYKRNFWGMAAAVIVTAVLALVFFALIGKTLGWDFYNNANGAFWNYTWGYTDEPPPLPFWPYPALFAAIMSKAAFLQFLVVVLDEPVVVRLVGDGIPRAPHG